MATSCDDVETKNLIRKYRKKLRQIEHLERLSRALSPDERVKVETKYDIRDELQCLLSEFEEENQDLIVESRENFQTGNVHFEKSSSQKWEGENYLAEEEADKDKSSQGTGDNYESQWHQPEETDKDKDVGAKVSKVNVQLTNPAAGDHVTKQEKKKKSSKQLLATSQFKVECLEGHNDLITSVVLHKGIVVSASHDTTVKTWDVLSGEQLKNFGGHTNSVTCLVILDGSDAQKLEFLQNDEPVIVSGSFDCTLKVWSLNSGKQLKSFYTYNPITKIAFVSIFGLIIIGTDTGKLELWDIDKGEVRYSICAYDASVTGIKVADKQLLSCASDGTIKVHSITDDMQLSCVFESENIKSTSGGSLTKRYVRSVEVCEGGLLIGDDARNIKLLNWRKNEANKIPNHHTDYSSTDALQCHGDFVIASSYDLDLGLGYLNVRCSHTLNYLASFDDKDTERIICVDFGHLQNGNMIIITGGMELKTWEILKQPSKKAKSEEIFQAEFRRSLADVAVDSEEGDSEDSDTDESDMDAGPQRHGSQQDVNSGGWMSWCSVL